MDDLIRLADAAHQLGLSHTQVYRLALRGDLPAAKRNERWFVSRAAVAALMVEREAESLPAA